MQRQQEKLALWISGAALVGSALALQVTAQDTPAGSKIKVQTSNVVVDVIVTDRHGRHVPGLSVSDFIVREDGITQTIVSFVAPEGTPVQVGGKAIPEDRADATKAAETQPPLHAVTPHLLTVVLDLADNKLANTKSSSDAVIQYLDKSALSGDYVSIYYIDRSLHMALPFTSDLNQARETLKQLEKHKPVGAVSGSDRASTQEEINDLYRQAHPETALGAVAGEPTILSGGGPGGGPSPGNNLSALIDRQIDAMRNYLTMENMFQARAVFSSLRAICLAYRDIPGRKNVVLFSEGFLYSDDAKVEMEAVAEAANRSNVAIYVIDPEGIEVNPYGAGSRPTDTAATQIAAAGAPGANTGQGGGQTKFDRIKMVGNLSRGDQLEWLADTTGGFTVKRTNDLVPAFNKVLEDGRSYYTLTYASEKRDFDGKFHSINVELAQRGYQLRYRKGYWAVPRSQAIAMSPLAAQLVAGLQSGSLKASFKPDVQAQLLVTADGHYSAPVAVSIEGKDIPMEKDGEELKVPVTLILVARDAQGNMLGASQRAWNFRVPEKERKGFEGTRVTLRGQVPVPELRPLLIEAILQFSGKGLARGGTAIRVPEHNKSEYALTTVLLSDKAESVQCADTSDALCFMNVRLNQPAESRFPRSSRVIVYFAATNLALDPQTKKPRLGVGFTLKLGDKLVEAKAENLQSLPGPTPDSVLVLAEYELHTLSPGTYTVHVATSDLVRKTSLTEDTAFVAE